MTPAARRELRTALLRMCVEHFRMARHDFEHWDSESPWCSSTRQTMIDNAWSDLTRAAAAWEARKAIPLEGEQPEGEQREHLNRPGKNT